MNKVVNIFSGLILALFCALVMAIIYDLSISSTITIKSLPYKVEICTGLALLILLLGALRAKRRWQGAADMRKFDNFTYVTSVARPAMRYGIMFTAAEGVFLVGLIIFLAGLFKLSPQFVVPMLIVLSLLLVDTMLFIIQLIKGGNVFRLGLNDKVVAYFTREINLIYYTRLKRIEMHQDMINFQFEEDLNIFIPLSVIPKNDVVDFRNALIATMEKRMAQGAQPVYMDDAFRTLE